MKLMKRTQKQLTTLVGILLPLMLLLTMSTVSTAEVVKKYNDEWVLVKTTAFIELTNHDKEFTEKYIASEKARNDEYTQFIIERNMHKEAIKMLTDEMLTYKRLYYGESFKSTTFKKSNTEWSIIGILSLLGNIAQASH